MKLKLKLKLKMKAITVKQPWFSLIQRKIKKIELRKWKTNEKEIYILSPFGDKTQYALRCKITEITPFNPEHQSFAKYPWKKNFHAWHIEVLDEILLKNKIRGKLGLFDVNI